MLISHARQEGKTIALGDAVADVVRDVGVRTGRLVFGGTVILDIEKLRRAAMAHDLEAVGLASAHFTQIAMSKRRVPIADDAADLCEPARGCFLDFVKAVI